MTEILERPDLHRHEILDRTSIICDMVDQYIVGPGVWEHLHADEKQIADNAATALAALYQVVGARNGSETAARQMVEDYWKEQAQYVEENGE